MIQDLVRDKQATIGVGAALHDSPVNFKHLWTKLSSLEVDVMTAFTTARKAESYALDAVRDVQKDIATIRLDTKTSLERTMHTETSIGAQTDELAQMTSALEALRKKCGDAQPSATPGATASSAVGGDAQTSQPQPRMMPTQPPTMSQGKVPQNMTNTGWTTNPVPPEDFMSWPAMDMPTRPTGASWPGQPQTAGPSASAHPYATPSQGAPASKIEMKTPQGFAGNMPPAMGEQSQQVPPPSPFGGYQGLGPSFPGLEPQDTLVVGFSDAVNYRRYRLLNTSPIATSWELQNTYELRKKIRGRDFRLEAFDGTDPFALLTFLPVLRRHVQ